MKTLEAYLTVAADSYCEYMVGYSIAAFGAEQAQELTGGHYDVVSAANMAAEGMYGGASKIVHAGLHALGGIPSAVTQRECKGVDDELSAFAVDAVDLAYNKFSSRIARLGAWTMKDEIVRPCILKSSEGTYMVRRSRIDKLSLKRLADGIAHHDFSEVDRLPLSELRKLIRD